MSIFIDGYVRHIKLEFNIYTVFQLLSCHGYPHQATSKRSIETIQCRAARFEVNNYDRKSSISTILSNLPQETLENRRTQASLDRYVQRNTFKLTPSNVQLRQRLSSTRQQMGLDILEIPSFNKICYQYSDPRTREWNLLPPDLCSISNINTLKIKLDEINVEELVKKAHFKI